jgi:hypothetical protein
VREIRKKFDERIQQEIVKVTSDDIGDVLVGMAQPELRNAAHGCRVQVCYAKSPEGMEATAPYPSRRGSLA